MIFPYVSMKVPTGSGGRAAAAAPGGARSPARTPRAVGAAVLALAVLASGCGASDVDRVRAAESAPLYRTERVSASSASLAPGAAGADFAPGAGAAARLGPSPGSVVPADEVAAGVLSTARAAAPDSGLSLQDCTDWIANAETVLESDRAQECATILAAAVDACQDLDCFTGPADAAAAGSAETVAVRADATVLAADSASPRVAASAPEGGHPPVPQAGMIPRDEPYWDYPTCSGALPWPPSPNCHPPSEWEVTQDLSDCWTPDVAGGVCASRKPDETPRQTRDVVRWTESCNAAWRSVSCEHLLSEMKWALDYLGAHPWCVLGEYNRRLWQYHDLWSRGSGVPDDMRNGHGWHRCPSVIDPAWPDDMTRRLSETGISLADQCRAVLPADVELETTTGNIFKPPERFGSDCDAWAAWVADRPAARHWRDCDRSARLAEEWMEHHYGVPENYFPVNC